MYWLNINKYKIINAKPQWGDSFLIAFTKKYNAMRDGIEPVLYVEDWRKFRDGESRWEGCTIECPFCFYHHDIIVDTKKGMYFFNDSNYCRYCEQEFEINPNNEFQIMCKVTSSLCPI